MDRDRWAFLDVGDWTAVEESRLPGELRVLGSRRRLLVGADEALRSGAGLLLVTGEPGAGKSWFWKQLARQSEGWARWIRLDATPSMTARDLFRRLAHAMGLGILKESEARLTIADFLSDQFEEDRRWVWVLEEAHNLDSALFEEIRILANRIGQPDGFASQILVGQSRLIRELRRQDLASFQTRLTGRFHLRPIDADEAGELLRDRWPDVPWTLEQIERLHADSAGNPRGLLNLAGSFQSRANPKVSKSKIDNLHHLDESDVVEFDPSSADLEMDAPAAFQAEHDVPFPQTEFKNADVSPHLDIDQLCSWPSLGAAMRKSETASGMVVDEDSIEVGWGLGEASHDSEISHSANEIVVKDEGDEDEDEDDFLEIGDFDSNDAAPLINRHDGWKSSEPLQSSYAPLTTTVEEIVQDPLTTLQALQEWFGDPKPNLPTKPVNVGEMAVPRNGAEPLGSGGTSSRCWIEGNHGFAPYSQLFSHRRPSRGRD